MSASLQELWAPWFAWHPVRTLDGRFLWLRRVRRRWNPMFELRALIPEDSGDYVGGWEYRSLDAVPGIRTASSR